MPEAGGKGRCHRRWTRNFCFVFEEMEREGEERFGEARML
jgi:hypothetical protein